ncbi:hypothetical protein LCGC14_1537110 [marine sediment metagenome]|uniref:Uncharacterized protein n=1 Tax=marine sediment metagenome TaxID=412755 RepID=A0A0F9LA12_9ZZZZ
MAQNEIELTIKWENNVAFEVTIKDNQHTLTLVKMEENGDIAHLWPSATDLMERFIKRTMERIGKEMST